MLPAVGVLQKAGVLEALSPRRFSVDPAYRLPAVGLLVGAPQLSVVLGALSLLFLIAVGLFPVHGRFRGARRGSYFTTVRCRGDDYSGTGTSRGSGK